MTDESGDSNEILTEFDRRILTILCDNSVDCVGLNTSMSSDISCLASCFQWVARISCSGSYELDEGKKLTDDVESLGNSNISQLPEVAGDGVDKAVSGGVGTHSQLCAEWEKEKKLEHSAQPFESGGSETTLNEVISSGNEQTSHKPVTPNGIPNYNTFPESVSDLSFESRPAMSEEKGTLGERSFQTSIQSNTSQDKATHEQDSGHWSMPHPHPKDTSRTDNQDETAKEQSKRHQILDSTKDENKASETSHKPVTPNGIPNYNTFPESVSDLSFESRPAMSEEKGTLGERSFQTSIQSNTSQDKATHEQDRGHWSMPHPHPQDTSRTDNQDETAKEQSKGHQILDSTKDENKASERDNRTIKNKRGVASSEQPSPPLDIKRKAIEEKQEDVQQPKRPKRDPGLLNIGNTCYMNCVLQCFYHTEELRKLLLSSDISINPNTETKGTITTALVDLLTRMSEDTSTRDALYKLKQVVGEHDPEFRGPRQREAHDFLSTMLKWLTEELGEDPKVLETEPISRPRLRPSSLVDLFYGVHRSTFTCERTNTVLLTRNDHFSNLILAVNSLDTCELTDVLEKYYESQMVMWHCKECQKDHECRHEIRISRLPPVLIVHFSRYNRYEIGGWRKAGVSSPRKGLSLDAHLDDGVQRGQTYDLYAFCTHTGTMTSGHYIAHHRDSSGTWIEHDDSYVQADVHPNFEQAHILFYRANQKELLVPLVEGGWVGVPQR